VKPLRLVVVGTLANDPYAGMAWMKMQVAVGLRRLGHDVHYLETTSSWPYDPIRQARVCSSDYAVPYLARVAQRFGMSDRWAYRRSYSDKAWFGPSRDKAEELLAHADAVFNVAVSTRLAEEGLRVGRLVGFGTDPVYQEIAFANGQEDIVTLIDEHDEFVTYGENIGNGDCPVPPLPGLRSKTRQPVLLDLWDGPPPSREEFTTVCNWKHTGHDIVFEGETYYWSKDREFLKFIDLPGRVDQPIELAMGLIQVSDEDRSMLESHGWRLADAHEFTTDPWSYRDYLLDSRAEFTVAKDQNVRLRSGWFSERSALYLASGRPVVTQDTGFGKFVPTGEGLFAFHTTEEAEAAVEEINADYERHSEAARAIAEEFFCAEANLARVLVDLGL
jgi:hypothetical protein